MSAFLLPCETHMDNFVFCLIAIYCLYFIRDFLPTPALNKNVIVLKRISARFKTDEIDVKLKSQYRCVMLKGLRYTYRVHDLRFLDTTSDGYSPPNFQTSTHALMNYSINAHQAVLIYMIFWRHVANFSYVDPRRFPIILLNTLAAQTDRIRYRLLLDITYGTENWNIHTVRNYSALSSCQ